MSKAESEQAEKPKSKMKLIVFALVGVVMLAGVFFAGRYLGNAKTGAHAPQAESAAAEKDEGAEAESHDKGEAHGEGESPESEKGTAAKGNGIINFDPFTVNLADPNAFRYLRVTLRVVVTTRPRAERLASTDTIVSKMRDTILGILSTKTSTEIITAAGKAQLKSEIKDALNGFLPDKPVLDVYFTDFVVQL